MALRPVIGAQALSYPRAMSNQKSKTSRLIPVA
jgi:hypothetical protein